MNTTILIARIIFILFTVILLGGALFVSLAHADMNGSNALAVLLSAAAAVGVISSWQIRREDESE